MFRYLLLSLLLIPVAAASDKGPGSRHAWNAEERRLIESLWLGNLPEPPADPGNAVSTDPRAAALGEKLFFDERLSSNGKISCASCHQPQRAFNDNLPRARGVGISERKTMTLLGVAYSPWLFWDGRKDSLWAQALGPLENPLEHGGNRLQYACLLVTDSDYRSAYQAVFGALSDLLTDSCAKHSDDNVNALDTAEYQQVTRVFVNIGKSIAAYERTLVPAGSRFDRYAEALANADQTLIEETLDNSEIAGLKLFIGKAQCIRCHNGPLFTNNEFHNTGVPVAADIGPDDGRFSGAEKVLDDEFNCLSGYSDATADDCAELRFIKTGAGLEGAFKTPTLRNIALTAPYMHSGQFAALSEVLQHYNRAAPADIGHNELEELNLNAREMGELEAFLQSLSDIP